MNWDHFLLIFNCGTALAVGALGIFVGALFSAADRRKSAPYLASRTTVGLAFLSVILSTRYLQGSPNWEGWVAMIVLWILYSFAMAVGAYAGAYARRVFERRR